MQQSPRNSAQPKRLFFIALLPPQNVQVYANQIKQHFATVYKSKAALKSPPHITIQPPFNWNINNLTTLEQVLQQFAQTQANIPIKLDGFSSFPPRVIYIDVNKTQKLLDLQKNLGDYLESSLNIIDKRNKNRDFNPHLTVGFKDLSKNNFYRAWEEFKEKKVNFNFTVNKLTLLLHNQGKWEIKKDFNLLNNNN